MGAFDWFWKAMGSQSERNNKKSKAIVGSADEAARTLSQHDDAAVAQAARDAVQSGEIVDKAQFLAALAVAVPLYGRAESLNVGTAATVCLYASARAQRRADSGVVTARHGTP